MQASRAGEKDSSQKGKILAEVPGAHAVEGDLQPLETPLWHI